jgi:3-phenylpropionate/trans-cinnamate dioxygenase ferredoxin reductase subunit
MSGDAPRHSADQATRVVVAGAGQAGAELAASLRQRGFAGSIVIVGDEEELPYQRPPLSKELQVRGGGLPVRAASFYANNRIDLRLGRVAAAIDRATATLVLDDGARLAYDHLVLATGARNRIPVVPGLESGDMLELRTLAHARDLGARLDALRHVTIIGGGFIGLEVAALMRARGIAVVIVEASDRLMGRVLSSDMGRHFADLHAAMGTTLRFRTTVAAADRRGSGFRVELTDGGEIATDAIMAAIGVAANDGLAAAAGLRVDNGIVVDALLRTDDPAISAIGDCAAHPNPFGAGLVRLESVQNAVDQARCTAARLSGLASPYDSLPLFWSHQGSARLQIAGLAAGADSAVRRGEEGGDRFSMFLYRGDRLVAVESLNSAADHLAARRILSSGRSLPKDAAADLACDLKSFAASAAQPS